MHYKEFSSIRLIFRIEEIIDHRKEDIRVFRCSLKTYEKKKNWYENHGRIEAKIT